MWHRDEGDGGRPETSSCRRRRLRWVLPRVRLLTAASKPRPPTSSRPHLMQYCTLPLEIGAFPPETRSHFSRSCSSKIHGTPLPKCNVCAALVQREPYIDTAEAMAFSLHSSGVWRSLCKCSDSIEPDLTYKHIALPATGGHNEWQGLISSSTLTGRFGCAS